MLGFASLIAQQIRQMLTARMSPANMFVANDRKLP